MHWISVRIYEMGDSIQTGVFYTARAIEIIFDIAAPYACPISVGRSRIDFQAKSVFDNPKI